MYCFMNASMQAAIYRQAIRSWIVAGLDNTGVDGGVLTCELQEQEAVSKWKQHTCSGPGSPVCTTKPSARWISMLL